MPNENDNSNLEAAGSWAKKYFFASRALVEAVLRPYDLGNSQWYVLYLLVDGRLLDQRELTRLLEVERATLSVILSALVRKGLIEQFADPGDKRKKVLRITTGGIDLMASIPDPIRLIEKVAFEGISVSDIETLNNVLRKATQQLSDYKKKEK